jgi:hypothetical protein
MVPDKKSENLLKCLKLLKIITGCPYRAKKSRSSILFIENITLGINTNYFFIIINLSVEITLLLTTIL